MKQQMIRVCCLIVALCSVVMMFSGCRKNQKQVTELTAEQTDSTSLPAQALPVTTAPVAPETMEEAVMKLVQLRLPGELTGSSWWNPFAQGDSFYAVAETADQLHRILKDRDLPVEQLDLEAYDEAFFAGARLVIVPRVSTSGAVRYRASFKNEVGGLCITVEGVTPEIATCDMADWLVLIPVSLERADVSVPLTVDPAGSPTANKTHTAW